MSDKALGDVIGSFIKHYGPKKNLSQSTVAERTNKSRLTNSPRKGRVTHIPKVSCIEEIDLYFQYLN